MRRFIASFIANGTLSLSLIVALGAGVAAGEGGGDNAGDPAPETAPEDGGSLMEKGARMFLEGLLREMEPALEGLEGLAEEAEPALREFAREMGPALAAILGKIDDLSNYELPEMLPNGDIIIRRKVPLTPKLEPAPLPGPMPGDQIEL